MYRYNRLARQRYAGEDSITIVFGAVPNKYLLKGGYLPVIWINGRRQGDTYSSIGYDLDEAIELAETYAREEAEHYVGDWSVSIREME